MSELSFLESSPSLASAIKHAEGMASKSGQPTAIYHRPINGRWFVIPASAAAPSGPTIKALVYAGAISEEKNTFEKCRRIGRKSFNKTESWKRFSDADQVEFALSGVRKAGWQG
jgi:hypothetical protein